jgi:hypothetical protein
VLILPQNEEAGATSWSRLIAGSSAEWQGGLNSAYVGSVPAVCRQIQSLPAWLASSPKPVVASGCDRPWGNVQVLLPLYCLQAPSNTCGLSKRGAAAFVRAVRRYVLQSQLCDVAPGADAATRCDSDSSSSTW